MLPDISIVIPVYNRGDLIRYTMESVRRAAQGLEVEIIVVDDGSATPVADDLERLGYDEGVRVIRQSNQGLLFARLAGLNAATGRYTLFLDSDDLIAPDKLRTQVAAMDSHPCDVGYSDTARCELRGGYDSLAITRDDPTRTTRDAADFFINIQPAPHSPIFRTGYLRTIVRAALFPPSALYNWVAEIWFYHNAAPRPARVRHVPGALAISGIHPAIRLTSHWERLGVASLAVMEAFARACPDDEAGRHAREFVAEKAFASWRRLPRGFSPEFETRLLAIWKKLRSSGSDRGRLGGAQFALASRLLGPVAAGCVFRRWQNESYDSCRTMPTAAVSELLASLPPP